MYKIQKYKDAEGMIKLRGNIFDAHDVVNQG